MDQKRKSNSLEDKITAMVEETEAIPPTPFHLIIPIIIKPMLNSPKAWMHMSLKLRYPDINSRNQQSLGSSLTFHIKVRFKKQKMLILFSALVILKIKIRFHILCVF